MSGKLLEFLTPFENVLIAIAAVALVWLLYRRVYMSSMQGFGSPFVWQRNNGGGLSGWARAMNATM